jgi:hypothetical protein
VNESGPKILKVLDQGPSSYVNGMSVASDESDGNVTIQFCSARPDPRVPDDDAQIRVYLPAIVMDMEAAEALANILTSVVEKQSVRNEEGDSP